MTRKTFLRLLIAMKFCVTGNQVAYRWFLPKRMKMPVDPMFWLSQSVLRSIASYPGNLPDDLFFTGNPLRMNLRFLAESNPMGGGTFIQEPIIYGDTRKW